MTRRPSLPGDAAYGTSGATPSRRSELPRPERPERMEGDGSDVPLGARGPEVGRSIQRIAQKSVKHN